MSTTLLVFACFLVSFLGIGVASSRRAEATPDDYLLAGRSVHPVLVGLSSVATNCSGYMFIGQIGLTYRIGVSSLWLAVGWIVGDALVWWTCYRRIRGLAEDGSIRTVPGLVARAGDRGFLALLGLLVLVFLGAYAAAQLEAGDKALRAVLGTRPGVGVIVGAGIVCLYSMSGGLRASIWTDAAQALVMLVAMTALLVVSLGTLGGLGGLGRALGSIDPKLVDPLDPGGAPWFPAWALGWLGAGAGVLGQPTIVIRTMAIERADAIPRAAATYFGWFVPFYGATILLGLCARVLLPGAADPEMALPSLATAMLPPALVGMTLAGIFAATMSTADSQLLACSAAVVEDVFPRLARLRGAHKVATVLVTAFAVAIALTSTRGVYALVLHAWGALGVTLGPLVALRAFGRRVRGRLGAAMCAAGLAGLFAWRAVGLDAAMYEIVPGAAAAFAVYGVATLRARRIRMRLSSTPGSARARPPRSSP